MPEMQAHKKKEKKRKVVFNLFADKFVMLKLRANNMSVYTAPKRLTVKA